MRGVDVCVTPTHHNTQSMHYPVPQHTQHALPSNAVSSSLLTCTWTTAAPRSDIDPRGLAGFLIVPWYSSPAQAHEKRRGEGEKGVGRGKEEEEEEEEVEM